MGEHKRIQLETDRSVYAVADRYHYAHVLDDDFEPVSSRFRVCLTSGGGEAKQRLSLRPDQSQPGL